MKEYTVKKLENVKEFTVEVPGSKSVTNRALLLAALGRGECVLRGVLFSEDTRAFLSCLTSLGFSTEVDEGKKTVTIVGTGGNIPNKEAEIYVASAGTAARFLTVFLAFAGGKYVVRSSEQMEKRPMQPLLGELKKAGVKIEYLKNKDCFPFILTSTGVKTDTFTIDTEVSSQFASALLMNATLCGGGAHIRLTGNRTQGAYIGITLKMMTDFGIRFKKRENEYFIFPDRKYNLAAYDIEPDFSAACYFFAAGAILNAKAKVKNLRLTAMQGDKKFLSVLERMGCMVREEEDGILLIGAETLRGVQVNMNDFSDQALTLAAIAPFATTPTTITGIEHIRRQECDRIHAMTVNLQAMGVKAEERADGITVYPCRDFLPAKIQTFNDHRVAMSFATAGLKCGGLTIENPLCCKKTFENFFDVLNGLYLGE